MSHKLLSRLVIAFALSPAMTVPAVAGDKVAVHTAVAEPIRLAAGKQLLLRSETTVLRTAVGDSEICGVNQYSAREMAIVARAPGKTEVTVWFSGTEKTPLIYVVEVQ
jgi:Flp pilus assembly secretin CpaC